MPTLTMKEILKGVSDILSRWEDGNADATETCHAMADFLEENGVPQ
jgi:hypothetical protein